MWRVQLFTRLQTRLQNFVMRCAIIARLCFSYAEACISMCHFWAQNGPFVLNKKFLVQTIIIIFIYLLALFIVQNLQKILTADPELWGCAIFGPKMVHFPKWEFRKKKLLMSLISFIHVYLHDKNQSQILIYYWNIDD